MTVKAVEIDILHSINRKHIWRVRVSERASERDRQTNRDRDRERQRERDRDRESCAHQSPLVHSDTKINK